MSFLLNKKNQSRCGNMYVWIGVIVVSILFTLFATIPNTQKYFEIRQSVKSLTEANNNYENEIDLKKVKLSEIEKEFNKIAKDFLKKEKLLFPENIDTDKIAKILELYSLQYSLISPNSLFEISSISFSKQESENFTKTSASISVKSNKESLKDFIFYIQNNQLPQKLLNAQNASGSLISNDVSTKNFLRENTLPIANIESIVSNTDEDGENKVSGLLNTDIQINFFSQKTKNEQ